MNTTAISLDELEYYHAIQPIMDISHNQVFGYEMLLRTTAVKNPEVLFNQAKQQNKLFELDMFSIGQAFQTINESVSSLEGLHVFINVLPATLSRPDALDKIKQLSASSKLDANRIVFEITEDKKDQELMMCQHTLGSMKSHGFLIAVDDLGKGDSTLTHAIELNPHVIKLDRKFARNLANSSANQREIEAMVNFFGNDKILILEGVEKEADLLTAEKLGIQYIQGFYFGKPEPWPHYLN